MGSPGFLRPEEPLPATLCEYDDERISGLLAWKTCELPHSSFSVYLSLNGW